MKADLLDNLALTKASLTSTLCYINELAESDTKVTRQSLKNIIDFLKVVALEQAEKCPEEYRADFVKIVHDVSNNRSAARSGSKSKSLLRLTNASATRKNMTGGAPKNGFQLSKFKKGPTKLNTAIIATRKAGAAAAGAVSSALDFLRIDQETRNYLRRLEKIQERALSRGNLTKAEEIQVKISEIREVYELFPSAPVPAVIALILYCIYKTPIWASALTRTGMGIVVALPAATAAAAAGKMADTAGQGVSVVGGFAAAAANTLSKAVGSDVEFANPVEFKQTDMAMNWANSTGRETNRLVAGILDASVPPEATEAGHMIGFFVFTPLLLFTMIKYNALVGKHRHEAQQRRVEAQKRVGEMLDNKETKLLENIKQEDAPEIENEMNTILTYFGLTEDEKKKDLKELQVLVKEKFTARIRTEHPNRGGRAENFDRTKQIYDNFKDLIIRIS